MLTLKAILKHGKIYFPDKVPPSGEHKVLVTILDEDTGDVVISENRSIRLRACVINQEALLNDRQSQILALASKALTGKEIGRELDLTFGAARNQFYRIYRKLEVKNRAEANSKGIEYGLINHGG